MKARRKNSKREPAGRRYRIEKKVKEFKKKVKKDVRKRKALGIAPKMKGKQSAGIPNIHPYKREIIDQLERKEKRD